ncbi:MAG: hypothetical protein WAO76_17070 [Georgfuchsia sp.]
MRQHPGTVMVEAADDCVQIETAIEPVSLFGEIAFGVFGEVEGMG